MKFMWWRLDKADISTHSQWQLLFSSIFLSKIQSKTFCLYFFSIYLSLPTAFDIYAWDEDNFTKHTLCVVFSIPGIQSIDFSPHLSIYRFFFFILFTFAQVSAIQYTLNLYLQQLFLVQYRYKTARHAIQWNRKTWINLKSSGYFYRITNKDDNTIFNAIE